MSPNSPALDRSSDFADQRSSDRHMTELAFFVTRPDDDRFEGCECRCENIGVGGLGLRLPAHLDPQQFAIGDALDISCELPGLDAPTQITGVVRWVDRGNERILGIQFATELRAREVWAINRMRKTA